MNSKTTKLKNVADPNYQIEKEHFANSDPDSDPNLVPT